MNIALVLLMSAMCISLFSCDPSYLNESSPRASCIPDAEQGLETARGGFPTDKKGEQSMHPTLRENSGASVCVLEGKTHKSRHNCKLLRKGAGVSSSQLQGRCRNVTISFRDSEAPGSSFNWSFGVGN